MRFIRYSLLIVSLLFIGSCGNQQESKQPVGDDAITQAVQSALTASQYIYEDQVKVQVKDGIVRLSGDVDYLLSKQRATNIAETVEGVRAVINNVVVQNGMPDDELTSNIESALATNAVTETMEIDAQVNNGKVKLIGVVESWPERQMAERVTASLDGVTEINNLITVDETVVRSDEQITADVKKTLKWNAMVDDGMVEVSVNEGVVTLSGAIGTAYQKRKAVELAHLNGVESVDAEGLEVRPSIQNEMVREEWSNNLSDDEVQQAVYDALAFDPRVSSFDITVEVDEGIVTLTGGVDNLNAKLSAGSDAANTMGVEGVNNEIEVGQKVVVRPDLSMDDEAVEERYRNAVLRSSYIEETDATIEVTNGIATVRGTVDSQFEKQRFTEVGQEIVGLIEIKNELTVAE